MQTNLSLGLEAIDFQRDEQLLKELSIHISALMGTRDKTERLDIVKRMNAVAFHHTQCLFTFHLLAGKQPDAFIFVADSNNASPMRADEVKKRLQKTGSMPTEKEFFKGSVDLRTGKCSGIYSEIPLDVFFSEAFLVPTPRGNMFKPEEIAAILIHEMGHGVMYLKYLGGLTIANIVVAEIITNIQKGSDPAVVRDIIKVAEQKTGYKIKDLGTVDKNPDPLIVQQVIMAQAIERVRSELGTRYYDARAFEFVADQFAARHGGAQYIVTGLDRMYRDYGWTPPEYSSRFAQIAMALVGQAETIFGIVAGLIAGASVLPILVGAAIWTAVGMVLATVATLVGGGDIYDDIPNRFKAMRRELIASSKDQNLSREQRMAIIKGIQTIDEVLERVRENSFGPGFLGRFVAGVVTGKTGQVQFMRQLEELANNRLFELTNQLEAKA